MSFSEQQARLRAFLDADDLYEEALDYVATHGYLTALSICPELVTEGEWLAELFGQEPEYKDASEQEDITEALRQLKAQIARQLASDEEFEFPCELDLGDEPDDSDMRAWCIGFMEGVFLREDIWFEADEEEVSELLLPMMVGSGLFEEQPDFAEIADDDELVASMLVQIPEVLTALFLLLRAPEEKPALLKTRD